MKLKVSILLICFAAFFVESIRLPFNQCTQPVKVTASSCPMKAKCMMAKQCNEHKSGKDKPSQNTNCLSCPLFSIFLAHDLNLNNDIPAMTQQKHILFAQGVISNYIPETWKPPNACSI